MIDNTQIIALLLLTGRIITAFYLVRVIRIQRKLLSVPAVDELGLSASDEVYGFRKTLYHMTWAILLGQFVPIIIDIANVLNGNSPRWLGFFYAISNVFTAITAAILIFRLYELAANVKEVTDLEARHIKRKHDKYRKDNPEQR